jgi:DNA-binding response OmpR family regulator
MFPRATGTQVHVPPTDRIPDLSAAGFRVTAVASYREARALLDTQMTSLLVTEVRLGAYNGLHLVMRARAATPPIPAIVVSPVADPVLRADAEAMGASFLVAPFDTAELKAAAIRTVLCDPDGPPPHPPFERRQTERRRAAAPCAGERRVAERRHDAHPLARLNRS